MLEDTSIQHLISWSKKGDQFNVPNPTTFSRTVLPQYFKHSNWQSFVRQLNMYGFHKVNDMIHANSSHQTWEFKHPYFKRGAIEDLQYIKRKNNNPNNITKARMIPDLQNDCSVYNHLIHVEDRLTHAVRTYQMLQNEMIMLKTLLSKQHGTMIEFAQLFSDVVQDRNITDGKRELILNKLHQLQIVLNTTIDYVDGGSASNSSNSSNSSSSSSSSNTISSTTTCSHSSDGNHLDTNGSRSSSINSINSNSGKYMDIKKGGILMGLLLLLL
ncbi:Putative Dihydroxyacetone kinase (Fragment) [Rhizopus microsporus]